MKNKRTGTKDLASPTQLTLHKKMYVRSGILGGARSKQGKFCTIFLACTYPQGSQDDASDLLLDRLLEDVGQCWHHVVAPQLLTELGAEGQQPNTEDHLVLELEAALVAQHSGDAENKTKKPSQRVGGGEANIHISLLFNTK